MQSPIHTLEELLPHILYEDRDLLVVHKPAGMAVQTKDILQKDMATFLQSYIPGNYVGIIQRLDQPVEGILVFGKTKNSTALLHQQLIEHRIEKKYMAVVCPKEGAPALFPGEKDDHEMRDYLLKSPQGNLSSVVPKDTPGSKESFLSYRTLSFCEEGALNMPVALLSIRLGTGRHHQIRVQLSHAHLPILGDVKYGVPNPQGLGLCATSLSFVHPTTGKKLHFEKNPDGAAFSLFRPAASKA